MGERITVNTSDYELTRARQDLMYGLGLDQKRPAAWIQYGYPETVTFDLLLRAYDRGGAGHGAVHRILDKCWQEKPRIKKKGADDESPWETKVDELLTAINGWQKLRDFDRRNLVGRYAGLIYRVADSKQLNEPLVRGTKLVDLVPLYESQIQVQKWNEDPTSENYGKPEMFQIETSPPASVDQQARPRTWLKVHPSRVQILAEGAVGGSFLDGVPLLKAGFNNLVDIEKIGGGAAEGFLKNSARTLKFEYDPQANVQAITSNPDGTPGTSSVREAHEEQTARLNRNQDTSIVIQGGKAGTLETTVGDPTASFNTAANLFAASVQIPFTILFGQQTGRLASDEDKADMVARCKSRQRTELTPALIELVTRLQAIGLIEEGEFEVEWLPLDSPGDTERLDNVSKMADINLKAFQAGDAPVFNTNEQRKAAGYEEIDGGDEMQSPDEKAQADAALQSQLAEDAAKAAAKANPTPAGPGKPAAKPVKA